MNASWLEMVGRIVFVVTIQARVGQSFHSAGRPGVRPEVLTAPESRSRRLLEPADQRFARGLSETITVFWFN